MNIGNSYHSMFYANNTTNTQSSSTNNVSQNSFLAQLEKTQETSQVEQTQKKDYSSMSLDELNNLSYEEYKTYGKEIHTRIFELYDTANAKGVYTDDDAYAVNLITDKVALADFTYDDNVNKALMEASTQYAQENKGTDSQTDFMILLLMGIKDYYNPGGITQTNANGDIYLGDETKESRTEALSMDGINSVIADNEKLLETKTNSLGMGIDSVTLNSMSKTHEVMKSILENLIKQIDVEVYI